ncbi:MAG: hypothetical protein OSA43_00655, partial [Pirellulales bacterium]|nr:hypothetical protein [Pirellulales bacterium]
STRSRAINKQEKNDNPAIDPAQAIAQQGGVPSNPRQPPRNKRKRVRKKNQNLKKGALDRIIPSKVIFN